MEGEDGEIFSVVIPDLAPVAEETESSDEGSKESMSPSNN